MNIELIFAFIAFFSVFALMMAAPTQAPRRLAYAREREQSALPVRVMQNA